MPVIQTVNIISQLSSIYGLQNTNTIVQGQLPIAKVVATDDESYLAGVDPYTDAYYNSDTPAVPKGPLGTPVYTNIIFKGTHVDPVTKLSTAYVDPLTGYEYAFDDIEFQTVLVSVSQAKKIIKTEIQGRNGTVKEYIGLDDYQITVNAVINGANLTYPTTQVTAVKRMLDTPVVIDIQCKYLEMLGIHTVVVESYQIQQEEGMYSQQKITINCISDTPVLLQINGF